MRMSTCTRRARERKKWQIADDSIVDVFVMLDSDSRCQPDMRRPSPTALYRLRIDPRRRLYIDSVLTLYAHVYTHVYMHVALDDSIVRLVVVLSQDCRFLMLFLRLCVREICGILRALMLFLCYTYGRFMACLGREAIFFLLHLRERGLWIHPGLASPVTAG